MAASVLIEPQRNAIKQDGSPVASLREGMAHVVVDNTIALIEGRAPVSCLNPQVLRTLF